MPLPTNNADSPSRADGHNPITNSWTSSTNNANGELPEVVHSPEGGGGNNNINHSNHSFGGSMDQMPGGGGGGAPQGQGNNGQQPSTEVLDACIRDLSQRRMVMAQQAAATANAVAAASGGGMNSPGHMVAAGGMGPPGVVGAGMGPPGMGGMNNNMGIKTEQQDGMPPGANNNNMGGQGASGSGGGGGGGGNVLANYAGTAADSFAQAFVDRWASKHKDGPTGAQQMNNNSDHSLTSEDGSGGKQNDQNRRASDASGGGAGAGTGGGSNKQWFVCDFCKNKAFISKVELKEHERYCEMNPMGNAGGGTGPAGISMGAMGAAGMSGGGAMGSASAGGMMGAAGGTTGMIGSSNGTFSRGGSLGSSAHSMGHPGMRGGMPGHHPVMAGHPHYPGMPPYGMHGMNPYMPMGMMCTDASGMMMGPAGMGPYGMPPPGMPGMMPDAAASASPAPPAKSPRRKPTVPIINQELIEASKGPFRQLPKPLALALDEDKDWLTPLHCFVRKNCVEVFTATEADVQTPSKGKRKPIQVGQIGIRCPHCHEGRMDTDPNRERGSVYYPTSLSSIYNATMNLLQRHLHSCPKVPPFVMEKYTELKKDDARSGTSKKYWIESAKSLGFVDTLQGIKMSVKEAPPPPSTSVSQRMTKEARGRSESEAAADNAEKKDGSDDDKKETKEEKSDEKEENKDEDTDEKEKKEEGDEKEGEAKEKEIKDGEDSKDDEKDEKKKDKKKEEEPAEAPPLVIPADKSTATAFSYLLLSQMQPCVFTEADRLGKRKGLPTGFAGLACRHCFGGYGSGRFFPSSIKTLSDTSKTLNVLQNHMSRCRKVPKDILEELETARITHDDERAKMKFGSQKAFFAKIWSRLHDNRPDGVVIKPPPRKPNPPSNGGMGKRGSSAAAAQNMMRWNAGMGGMGMGMNGMMGGMGPTGMAMAGPAGMPPTMHPGMMQHPMMMGGSAYDHQMMAAQMGAPGPGWNPMMGGMGGMPPQMSAMGAASMGGGRGMPGMDGSSHSGHSAMEGANKRSFDMHTSQAEMSKKMRMPPQYDV